MQKVRVLIVCATTALLGMVATAQQSPATTAAKPAAPRPAGGAPAARAVATVQDVMVGVIDPASKLVFKAVSSEVTPTGTVETVPKNDREWAVVRRNAALMVEGANLLMMPGRPMAVALFANEHADGELSPAEIEVRVAKERTAWNKFVVDYRDAALLALKAADAKRTEDFPLANDAVDTACENCHLKFWYPDQDELLKNAPKAK